MTFDVKVIVFVDNPNTVEQKNQIQTFNRLGYSALVDSIHKRNYEWLYKNIINGRFFIQDGEEVYMFDREELMKEVLLVPDFSIVFPDDKEILEADWSKIYKYIEAHITSTMEDLAITEEVEKLMGKPLVLHHEPLEEIKIDRGTDYYNLETRYLEEDDVMLYEVTKPFTDLPYTSVTRNYSKKGHLPFFTDLFIAPSWGVARSDIAFLNYTWKEFKMEGDFNLDELMKTAIQKCTPNEDFIPEPEPTVYRRDIQSVIEILEMKKTRMCKVIPEYIKNKN